MYLHKNAVCILRHAFIYMCNRYRKLPRFTTKLPSVQQNYLTWNPHSSGLCPDLTVKERTAAALAWHGGHWPCDWCRAAINEYQFEQHTFRQSCVVLAKWLHWLIWGISKSFNFVLLAIDSVWRRFYFVFDRIRSFMASANDNTAQLPAESGQIRFSYTAQSCCHVMVFSMHTLQLRSWQLLLS